MSLNTIKDKINLKESWADGDGYWFKDYFMAELSKSGSKLSVISVIMSCLDEYSRSTTNPVANYLRSQEFKRLSIDKKREVISEIFWFKGEWNAQYLIKKVSEKNKDTIAYILSQISDPKKRVVNKEIIKLTDSDIISLWTWKWHLEFERLFLDEKKAFLDAFVLSAQSIKWENEEFNKVFMSYIDKNTFKKEKFLAKICSVTYWHTSRTKFLESIYKNIPRASSRYQEIIDKFYLDKQKKMKDLGLVKNLRNTTSVK